MVWRLAADIGGTKTLLALVERGDQGSLRIVEERRYENQQWPELEAVIRAFLAEMGSPVIEEACLAVAGPVLDNRCTLSNLSWELDGTKLSQHLGIPTVILINDFAAVGYGILYLAPDELLTLQPGIPELHAPMALIGAGTGLGEGYLIWQQEHYQVYASEGGHTDFAPRSDQEYRLLTFLRHRYSRVSVERVVSGLGISNIYDFLGSQDPTHYQVDLCQQPGTISERALEGRDPLAAAALELFVQAYGAEAGNLALKILPGAGLFIAGGIAAKILPLLTRYGFMEAFLNKGRMGQLLTKIPVYVILNPQVGLIGAAHVPLSQL